MSCLHKGPQLGSILSHLNPVHTLTPYSCNNSFNISLLSTSRSLNSSIFFWFWAQIVQYFAICCYRPRPWHSPWLFLIYRDPATVAALSKARTVFARSDAGIMGSIPTQDMAVLCACVCSIFVLPVLGSGLATGWSLVREVLLSVKYDYWTG
jgi:hypothetical protein